MKILLLKALNINSFRENIEIDFETLTRNNSIFLITGATGSGKSTILDIISCALYGRTVRLKNPNFLISKDRAEAFCEIKFEIKGKIYRSSWSQRKARKKLDGKFQTAKMELVDVDTDKILASTLKSVIKKNEELSGLDFERFTQSILLAQDSFNTFLKANENAKSSLLEKITGTKIYADISIYVFEKYKSLSKEIELENKLLDAISILDDDVVILKKNMLEKNRIKKIELDKKLEDIFKNLELIDRIEKLTSKTKTYKQNFIEIKDLKEKNHDKFEKVYEFEKALNISSIYQEYKQFNYSIKKNKTEILDIKVEIDKLDNSFILKDREYNKVKEKLDNLKIPFEKNLDDIKIFRDIEIEKQNIKQDILKIEKSLDAKEKELRFFIDKLKNLNKKTELNRFDLDKNNIIIDRVYEILISNFSLIEQNILIYKDEKRVFSRLNLDLKNNEQKLKIKNNLKDNLKDDLNLLKENSKNIDDMCLINRKNRDKFFQYLKNSIENIVDISQMEELQFNLKKIEDEDISKEIIFNKKLNLQKSIFDKEKELNRLDFYLDSLEKENEKIKILIKESKIKIENIFDKLYKDFQFFDIEIEDDIEKSLLKLGTKKDKFEKTTKKIKILEKTLNDYKLEKVEIETKIEALNIEKKKDIEYKRFLLQKVDDLKQKQKDILDIPNIDDYEKEILKDYQNIEIKLEKLKNDKNNIQIKKDEKKKNLEYLLHELDISSKRFNEICIKLEEIVVENGFNDLNHLEQFFIDDKKFNNLKIFCKNIDKKYAKAKILINEKEKELYSAKKELKQDFEKEKLIKLQINLKQELDCIQEEIGSLKKELELNDRNSKKYKKHFLNIKYKKEEFKVWMKMYELIGSKDGVKFKKFAQSITLDYLINLANQHLKFLNQRYILIRNKEKTLELEVVDSYQGDFIRCVSTLSGGESFIISLALALGLSQLASQKIYIESLFLDEGFGTLDSDSLEMALNALNILQSKGKMIGIISHIEELKERIPTQINVVARGDGTSFIAKN